MAHAYTPGLRVTEKTVLIKDRRLPLPGQIVVKKGDRVKADTVVARTDLPGNIQTVNVASALTINPSDVPEAMLKKEGDPVTKGEPIAKGGGFFGFFQSTVKSPIDGFFESVSNVTGKAILREPPIPIEINAYVDGVVVDVFENEGIAVETVGTFIQGIFGVGGETHGELKVVTESPAQILDESFVTPDCKDKIIGGGSLVTAAAIQKAIDTGVRGIVVGGLNDSDLREFLGYDLGVAITGSEDLGISLVITEGFGQITMARKTFHLLQKSAGRHASINGATQIRAGVIRPEIIIPISEEMQNLTGSEDVERELKGMDIGTPIRVIRNPYFGILGTVTALPPELTALETEAKVRVLRAKLEGVEQEVTLPRANVEMIEE